MTTAMRGEVYSTVTVLAVIRYHFPLILCAAEGTWSICIWKWRSRHSTSRLFRQQGQHLRVTQPPTNNNDELQVSSWTVDSNHDRAPCSKQASSGVDWRIVAPKRIGPGSRAAPFRQPCREIIETNDSGYSFRRQ